MKSTIQQEILNLTKELIRIPSTHSRPEEISRCADFIEAWLNFYSIPYHRYDIAGVPSITVLPENRNPKVLLVAHFDVVEAENENLFCPTVTGDRLTGRGAIDDKYAIALALVLYREQFTSAPGQQPEFGLLFTGDEEVGGANGAAKMIDAIDTDFFIALDGGHPDLLVTKEKGILVVEMEASGKSAHAARPWLGRNGFDIIVRDYLAIQDLFQETRDDHWHKTMVLSQCSAGSGSTNTIPQKAKATLDIRFTENDDVEEILTAIKNRVESTIKVIAKEPVFSGGTSPYLDLLVECAGSVKLGAEHGASDARFFSTKGITGVIWGADGEMSQHTENEHVSLTSIYHLYDKLATFLEKLSCIDRPILSFRNLKN